jgi:hypothetical protein
MSEEYIYQINCNQCNFTKQLKHPFFSDLKESNKKYMICDKCKQKTFYQFKNEEIERLPIFLKSIIIKKR